MQEDAGLKTLVEVVAAISPDGLNNEKPNNELRWKQSRHNKSTKELTVTPNSTHKLTTLSMVPSCARVITDIFECHVQTKKWRTQIQYDTSRHE